MKKDYKQVRKKYILMLCRKEKQELIRSTSLRTEEALLCANTQLAYPEHVLNYVLNLQVHMLIFVLKGKYVFFFQTM